MTISRFCLRSASPRSVSAVLRPCPWRRPRLPRPCGIDERFRAQLDEALKPFAVGTIRATISSKGSKGNVNVTLSAMAACSASRLAGLSLRPRCGGVAARRRGGAARFAEPLAPYCAPRRLHDAGVGAEIADVGDLVTEPVSMTLRSARALRLTARGRPMIQRRPRYPRPSAREQLCSGMIFLDRTKCDPVCRYNVCALPA